jgi:hypothetical protein
VLSPRRKPTLPAAAKVQEATKVVAEKGNAKKVVP